MAASSQSMEAEDGASSGSGLVAPVPPASGAGGSEMQVSRVEIVEGAASGEEGGEAGAEGGEAGAEGGKAGAEGGKAGAEGGKAGAEGAASGADGAASLARSETVGEYDRVIAKVRPLVGKGKPLLPQVLNGLKRMRGQIAAVKHVPEHFRTNLYRLLGMARKEHPRMEIYGGMSNGLNPNIQAFLKQLKDHFSKSTHLDVILEQIDIALDHNEYKNINRMFDKGLFNSGQGAAIESFISAEKALDDFLRKFFENFINNGKLNVLDATTIATVCRIVLQGIEIQRVKDGAKVTLGDEIINPKLLNNFADDLADRFREALLSFNPLSIAPAPMKEGDEDKVISIEELGDGIQLIQTVVQPLFETIPLPKLMERFTFGLVKVYSEEREQGVGPKEMETAEDPASSAPEPSAPPAPSESDAPPRAGAKRGRIEESADDPREPTRSRIESVELEKLIGEIEGEGGVVEGGKGGGGEAGGTASMDGGDMAEDGKGSGEHVGASSASMLSGDMTEGSGRKKRKRVSKSALRRRRSKSRRRRKRSNRRRRRVSKHKR